MDTPTRPAHVPGLDGLRGVAVAGVVAFHLGYLDGGYLGVDLFFTLSGFLITRLLIVEHQANGRISFGSFLGRRARRLLPALLVMLAVTSVFTRRWSSPTDFGQFRGDALATLGYVANWREVAANTDYWALFARPSPLQHTWSVAVEEQFYLVWPLAVMGVLVGYRRLVRARPARMRIDRRAEPSPAEIHRRALTWLLGLSVVAAVASGVLAALLPDDATGVNRIYFGTDTRVAAILFGAALAIGVARFGDVPTGRARTALEVAAIGAVAMLGVGWFRLSGSGGFLFDGGLALCGIGAALIIAAISHPQPGPLARVFSLRPLAALGLISYGVYLWHWPVITALTVGRVGLSGLQLTLLRIAVSLGLALLSYHLLEQPIRRGALSGWAARVSVPAAFASVIVLVLWSTTGAVVPISEQPTGRQALRIADDPVPPVKQAGTRVLVVGDSGAYAMGGNLRQVGATRDVEVVNRGTPACGIARGGVVGRYPGGRLVDDPPKCGQWPTRWAQELREVEPDVVVLVNVAPGGVARQVQGRWRTDCDPVFDRWYRHEVEVAIKVLRSSGARVAITTIAYFDSTVDADGSHRHTDCRNRTVKKAARIAGAQVLDLSAWVCPGGGRCRTSVAFQGDQAELRPDGMHYSGDGALVVSGWILDQLTPR